MKAALLGRRERNWMDGYYHIVYHGTKDGVFGSQSLGRRADGEVCEEPGEGAGLSLRCSFRVCDLSAVSGRFFVDGLEEGSGVQEDKNGNRAEGFFKQGKKDGPFVEKDKDGNIIRKVTYKMGRIVLN